MASVLEGYYGLAIAVIIFAFACIFFIYGYGLSR